MAERTKAEIEQQQVKSLHPNSPNPGAGEPDAVELSSDPVVELAEKHPALILTLLLISLNIGGILYSWLLFKLFRINYFDFSETSDFLLAAIKHPYAIVLTVGVLLSVFVFLRRGPQQHQLKKRHYIVVSLIISIGIPIGLVIYDKQNISSGNAAIYQIRLSRQWQHPREEPTTETETGSIISKTSNFFVIHDHSSKQTKIIPITNVRSMALLSNKCNVRWLCWAV